MYSINAASNGTLDLYVYPSSVQYPEVSKLVNSLKHCKHLCVTVVLL